MLPWIAVAVLVAGVVATIVWVVRRRRAAKRTIVSVVMLRPSKRMITEADARGAARRALGSEVDILKVPSPDPASTELYAVILCEVPAFYIISAGRPYSDNPAEFAATFEDPRARRAYAEHRAWVSVDVIGGMPPPDVWPKVRQLLGNFAAEFYDHDCLMLYAPSMERVALPSPQLEEQLKKGDLSSVFGDAEVNTPIFQVPPDDKRVERAIKQAQAELPKFVEVWNRCGVSSKALVKGRFVHGGGNEYMWVEVKSLTPQGSFAGVLVNEPAHVPLKKGQTVTIDRSDVADWACIDGEKAMGMFVERILRH